MNEFDLQARQFADKYGVKLTILDEDYGPFFPEDKESRSIFKCRLSRGRKSYTFRFGQALARAGEEPTMYDILAILQKSDPEDFENFCSEYGYDTDSRRAYDTWKAVTKEWKAVERLFGDCLEELWEIQ